MTVVAALTSDDMASAAVLASAVTAPIMLAVLMLAVLRCRQRGYVLVRPTRLCERETFEPMELQENDAESVGHPIEQGGLGHRSRDFSGDYRLLVHVGDAAPGDTLLGVGSQGPLGHLVKPELDFHRWGLPTVEERLRAVQTFRQDPLSRAEDKFDSIRATVASHLAWAKARPVLLRTSILVGRLFFFWDVISDFLVAEQLRPYHPTWSRIAFGILLCPYMLLSVLLRPQGFGLVLSLLHPRCSCIVKPLETCWILWLLLLPVLPAGWAFIDLSFVLQHLVSEPSNPQLFHFCTLRLLVETFAEQIWQVLLQAYIFLRQEDFFELFPKLKHTSVAPTLLLLSLVSGLKASHEQISKLQMLAELQTGGSKLRFLEAVRGLGRGLAPSNIVMGLGKLDDVSIIAEQLQGLDMHGFLAIIRAARASKVLRRLTMDLGAFEERMLENGFTGTSGRIYL